MKTLGLDIGTSTISAVVFDSEQGVLASCTVENNSFLRGHPWERLQDPGIIYNTAIDVLRDLFRQHPDVCALGISGQMHGIVYLDAEGNSVSPLYTWQDGRGDLPFTQDCSWASHLSSLTGYCLASGYGMVTHFYNLHHGLIPETAVVLCTIQDYLAMKLSGRNSPLMDATNAASLGLYDNQNHRFDIRALEAAGIDPGILPELAADPCLGTGILGIPVYIALGDNQASFLGASGGRTDVLLVNIGTGGQISLFSPDYLLVDELETRPFPNGGWLLVGASLCGGRSYALLEQFFRETVKLVTGQDICAYDAMAKALDTAGDVQDAPRASTLFQGTRKDPSRQASIEGIRSDNFTPVHFMHSILQGMADELYEMYQRCQAQGGSAPSVMIGSGNGLRKNPHLCKILEKTFGCPLVLSEYQEEAACGAAIYAAKHCQ